QGWANSPVTIQGTCKDIGPAGCKPGSIRIKLYEPGTQPDTCPTSAQAYSNAQKPPITVNRHVYVCVFARDHAGNIGAGGGSPSPAEIMVDSTPPDVNASTVSPTDDPRQPVNFTVDEANLDTCTASGAGVSWSCSLNGGQGTCSPQTDIANGDHTVTITCRDKAGNEGTASVSMTVDTVPPSITCNGCDSPDPITSGKVLTFNPSISDQHTSVQTAQVCMDQRCGRIFCTLNGSSCSYRTEAFTRGVDEYWIRATDIVNNRRTRGPYRFTKEQQILRVGDTRMNVTLGTTAITSFNISNPARTQHTYAIRLIPSNNKGAILASIQGADSVKNGIAIKTVDGHSIADLKIGISGSLCFQVCQETLTIQVTDRTTGKQYTATIDVTLSRESQGFSAPGIQIWQFLTIALAGAGIILLERS
ncbi:MAG: Ig-like domain-containing protein, partial [Candidatus Nanohaloarchaea archaeon]|nr:Ig-like domain-containing protein [Candidatus Nanohaloarchaea archaeon]